MNIVSITWSQVYPILCCMHLIAVLCKLIILVLTLCSCLWNRCLMWILFWVLLIVLILLLLLLLLLHNLYLTFRLILRLPRYRAWRILIEVIGVVTLRIWNSILTVRRGLITLRGLGDPVVERWSNHLSLALRRHNCWLVCRVRVSLTKWVGLKLLLNLIAYHTHQAAGLVMLILLSLSALLFIDGRNWRFIISFVWNLSLLSNDKSVRAGCGLKVIWDMMLARWTITCDARPVLRHSRATSYTWCQLLSNYLLTWHTVIVLGGRNTIWVWSLSLAHSHPLLGLMIWILLLLNL